MNKGRNSGRNLERKAISPLIAAVILVAIVLTIGIFLSSSFNSIFKQKVASTTVQEKCSSSSLQIVHTGCSGGTVKATILNTGQSDLSNFSIFANVNNNIYINNTPLNTNAVISPGGMGSIEAATNYTGKISKLRITAGGDCAGVYIEVNNETTPIGTC